MTDFVSQSRLARTAFIAAGGVLVCLGVIGAFVPVMPTTIFMIGALACFARGSPKLERWLLDHPRFGPPLRVWKTEGAISARAKGLAVAAMAISLGIVMASSASWIVPVAVGVVLLGVAAYVVTRPLPR
jgi:uncharacterized membrane protein YbaN (DUF454 family)